MTHEDNLRFRAIGSWVLYALYDRANPWEAAEAIEGLAARIRADHSPPTNASSATVGPTNETAGRGLAHLPGHGPDLRRRSGRE